MQNFGLSVFCVFCINELNVDIKWYRCVLYPGVEVGCDLAQTDCGVASDRALFVSGLQPGKVTHQLLVQVGLIQLGSEQQHRLEEEQRKRGKSSSSGAQVIFNNFSWF